MCSQNVFQTPSSFAASLNTCQMSSCPLMPLKVFLHCNTQLCATTSPKVSPCSKHTDLTLPIIASTFYLIFLFLYAEPNFKINNEEIDDTDLTDCEELSQELEEDVSNCQGGFQILAGFVFVEWSLLAGCAFGKPAFLDNFSPFDSWGVSNAV